jgi:hypothetical protein
MIHTNPAMITLASTVTDFLLIIAMGLIIGRNGSKENKKTIVSLVTVIAELLDA